jgi:hypothetical protein
MRVVQTYQRLSSSQDTQAFPRGFAHLGSGGDGVLTLPALHGVQRLLEVRTKLQNRMCTEMTLRRGGNRKKRKYYTDRNLCSLIYT